MTGARAVMTGEGTVVTSVMTCGRAVMNAVTTREGAA